MSDPAQLLRDWIAPYHAPPTSVATISADGVVRPAGPGTATITCTVDGQTLTCIVRCNF